jgi:stage IV sporulation protein FB
MRVGVHWLFVALLLGASLMGYQHEALILLGSLAAHEFAHLAVAWVLGFAVEDLMLTPFGGMARLDSTLETDPQAETSIALAGPFQSFLLAGLALFLLGDQLWDERLVRFFFEVNVNLAFFNLLPALPLDGGRALRGLLAQRWGYRRVSGWMVWLGRTVGLTMTMAAMLVLILYHQFYATPLVGGIFLCLGAGRELEGATYRSYRQFLRKRERLERVRVLTTKQLVAGEGTRLKEVMPHMAERRYHLIVVVDSDLRPIGTLHEAELIEAFHEWGPEVTLAQILER